MMININAAKCIGIDAVSVTVEVDITNGIGIHLVGLADAAVKESLLRTVTALQALDFKIPGKKIIINLAPAFMTKNGSGYDLPIALGIIAASGQRDLPGLGKYIIMGELGLDGSIREVSGALPTVELAIKSGLSGCILPLTSAMEAIEYGETLLYGVTNLAEVLKILEEKEDPGDLLVWNTRLYQKMKRDRQRRQKKPDYMDFSEIIGQEGAKRGVEIACAGGHNIIFMGPPGAGKSSLAKAMAGILPPMTTEEAVVTSKIYSVAGRASGGNFGLIRQRPFRSPHYSASMAAIIGGGGGDSILPGEVTLAQNGILFLDELALMPKSVIEALRGPVEDRRVSISRLKSKVEFPSSFMLVAASNPCPCGYYGEGDRCTCTPTQRQSYLAKLSGPILDRIDLHVWMHPVPADRILRAEKAENSEAVAARVLKARIAQKHRFAPDGPAANAEMSSRDIERFCPLSEACRTTLERLMTQMGFSMRAYFRIIKVARTIADLEGADDIRPSHLLEAASYRFLDRRNLNELMK